MVTALAVSEMAHACLCVILPKFPMNSRWPRFCRDCMDGLRFPALVLKNCFSGSDRTLTIMRRFCGIQPVQIHHPHLRRLTPSR